MVRPLRPIYFAAIHIMSDLSIRFLIRPQMEKNLGFLLSIPSTICSEALLYQMIGLQQQVVLDLVLPNILLHTTMKLVSRSVSEEISIVESE